MIEYEYIGCFFDYAELFDLIKDIRVNPLKNEKQKPHVTFKYKPDTINTDLFGEEISVNIIGYGNDGENEGLLVTLTSESKELTEMIQQIPVPHITLAVSDNGKAVNTRYLDFTAIEPRKISGFYNGHIDYER